MNEVRCAARRHTRRTALRTAIALAGAGLASAGCASADQPSTSRLESSPNRSPWGAFIPTVVAQSESARPPIAGLTALAGAAPKYLHIFRAIGDAVPVNELDAIIAAGATPLLTLEPWLPDAGVAQPQYALARVAAGAFDADLARWGSDLASWGHPLLLRWAQEMNGDWYPWAVGVNGNSASDYRAAWARMRAAIEPSDRLRLVWAPNTVTLGTSSFAHCYPGDDAVDVLGIDGYNWGDLPGHHWQGAAELFTPGLHALNELGGRQPILITEVASAEGATAQDKAQWISDFFGVVANNSRVAGFVWFQIDKERDWRFNSTPQSAAAFRAGLQRLRR